MKAEFSKTVDILVKAYLNDTLSHSDCKACAVGNIVKHHLPDAIIHRGSGWPIVFCTVNVGKGIVTHQEMYPEYNVGEAKRQIDSTGYSVDELAKIEHVFETAPIGNSDEEWMFNGLMAVVDVLADIHKIDLKEKEEAKLLFIRP